MYHKLKLAYHRSSMKKYYNTISKLHNHVKYIDYNKVTNKMYKELDEIHMYDPYNKKLINKLNKITKVNIIENLQFLQSLAEDNESLDLPDLEENIDDFLHALSNAKEFDPKARGLKHKSKKYKKNKTIKKSKKSKRI